MAVAPDPLLLVHGYGDSLRTPWWQGMADQLAAAGYDPDRIHSLDQGTMGVTVGSPRQYAERVLSACRSIAADGNGSVDVLAHSMGGLSARWAVERLGGDEYVDDLVTLGTPHQGTYLAYAGLVTAGGRAMLPGSSFLRDLNGDPLAPGVEYTAVWSDRDGAIVPGEHAAIPPDLFDSMAGARNVRVDASHMDLVCDAGVFEAYADFLG